MREGEEPHWTAELTWYSPSTTHRISLNDLGHGFGINTFRSSLPCQIVDVLTTGAKFLRVSSITQQMFLVASAALWPNSKSSSINNSLYTFIFATFKSFTAWTNAQCISALTTTILLTTADTFHGLNCFGHVVYALQTLKNVFGGVFCFVLFCF